jgi:MoaA/NifB/PqqE/SkfB family radical SAM enzyme
MQQIPVLSAYLYYRLRNNMQRKNWRKFKAQREASLSAPLCYAPFIAMNFDQSGKMTVCCFNRTHTLGRYPNDSIADAWNSSEARLIREDMLLDDLSRGCFQCASMLEAENFDSVLIRHFDDHAPLSDVWMPKRKWWHAGREKAIVSSPALLPVMFEFELSNTCNLECIMCGGHWSSAIRKNRENLPAISSPYDGQFVLQIKDFLPTLRRANFLGGEPFLIGLYYDIWEAIIDINPQITVAITSNGTILNKRAKEIIEKLPNCHITLSIDSLNKATWERIRINGDFEVLKSNMDWLLKSGKLKSFSVCPMIQNKDEVPGIVQFCADHQLDVFFNVVYGPLGGEVEGVHFGENSQNQLYLPEVSLKTLNAQALSELIKTYRAHSFIGRYRKAMDSLIAQLTFWLKEKESDAE